MQRTGCSTILYPQDSEINFQTIASNTNKRSCKSARPSRQSLGRSKLPKNYKTNSTILASSSSIDQPYPEIKELKVSLPLFYLTGKIESSDETAAQAPTLPISIRIPITTTLKTEAVRNKIPEEIKIPAPANDLRALPGFHGDEREGQSELVSFCESSIAVQNLEVKPPISHEKFSEVINKSEPVVPTLPDQTTLDQPSSNGVLTLIKRPRGRPRKHPVTVKSALSGRLRERPLKHPVTVKSAPSGRLRERPVKRPVTVKRAPSGGGRPRKHPVTVKSALSGRPRGRYRRIMEILDAEFQKTEDYPESAEQRAELEKLNTKIQETDGDIKRLKFCISEIMGKIKEQETKNWEISSTFVKDAWKKWLNLPNVKNDFQEFIPD